MAKPDSPQKTQSRTQTEKRYYLTAVFSSLVGIVTSFYLLIQHTRLTHGIQEGASFCSFGKYADCDVVNASRYSDLLGIPLGAWGASYFALVLTLLFLGPPRDKSFRFFLGMTAWLAALGIGVDLFYFGIQIFALKTVCILCLLTYLANFLILFSAYQLTPTTHSRIGSLFLGLSDWVPPRLVTSRLMLGGIAWLLFAAVTLLVPAQIISKSANYIHADQAIEQFFSQWRERPSRKIEINPGNGTWGNPSARVTLVEFSDFECPFCRKAAFTLHTVLKPFKERVYFVFKNFPLDSTCNPALPYQIHAHACKLAKIAACSNLKGDFWKTHDALFLKMDDDDMKKGFDHIENQLKKSGGTPPVEECLQDPKAAESVTEDIKVGQSLNVRGTPAIFINGKQVTIPLTIETLQRLIELEEKNAGAGG